ncbi:ubiquitin ligase [Tritrichomonas foetus]|uniref:HECT-type E3 ubiquitin transferase n=1 Tax=Tritrichomonas foetus TaxID=1144522 RepID=A0A1J4L161_9EUKA|nr:ubiquitin ligase [Tritrichomonas foetus]|eukprot:OHT15702.1 ubiquitin ligase [Tritrichomonas foetus]
MNADDLFRAYCSQVLMGCDAVKCDNPFCKSCKDFQFSDISRTDITEKALKMLREHTRSPKLCDHLSPNQLDKNFFTQNIMTSIENFRNIESLTETKLEKSFSNSKYFPFFLLKDKSKYPSDKFNFDDETLIYFYNIVNDNQELFSVCPEYVFTYIVTFTNHISDVTLHNYSTFRAIYVLLFLLSIWKTNDIPNVFKIILDTIINFKHQKTELHQYLIDSYKLTPKVFEKVLDFVHDNLTFFSISEGSDAYSDDCKNMIEFMGLLHQAYPFAPTDLFISQVFTECLMNSHDMLVRFLKGQFSYLNLPYILTLRAKSKALSQYYLFVQDHIANAESSERQRRGENVTRQNMYFYVTVNRDNLIEDTIKKIYNVQSKSFLKTLRVVFEGEQGVDVGGVSREFFYLVCNDIFSPKYGMFSETPNGKFWFTSPFIGRLIDFSVMGTVVGLAIYNSVILPIRFPLILYKKLWNKPLLLEDYAGIDPELVESFHNLRKMRDNGQDISLAEMTFSITRDNYGASEEIPLVKGGLDKIVTNENLEEYIQAYSQYLMVDSIEEQFKKFQTGFDKIMNLNVIISGLQPLNIFKIIAYDEGDILVSGEEIIHWEYLKENAKYTDGYNKDSQAVIWFWEIFDEMTAEQKQQFFRFSTGSDRAPVCGLNNFNLTIQKTNDISKLPVAHTCFNIFSLPDYKTKEEMKHKILISIVNTEGFGLI